MPQPRKSYYWWIIGKILYALFGLAILAMTLFLLWRVYFSGKLPGEMKSLVPNDTLKAAYQEHGGNLTVYTQEQSTHTRDEHNYGYFAVPRFVYVEEAKQMQVVFRYNNSTLEATAKDFGLAEEPKRGEEIFDVTLLQINDLTPECKDDNQDGNENLKELRIHPTAKEVTTTSLYTYFIYTFDGVSIDSDTLVVYFDIYYGGAVDYEKDAYGTLRLYHYEQARIDVELSNKERKKLSE